MTIPPIRQPLRQVLESTLASGMVCHDRRILINCCLIWLVPPGPFYLMNYYAVRSDQISSVWHHHVYIPNGYLRGCCIKVCSLHITVLGTYEIRGRGWLFCRTFLIDYVGKILHGSKHQTGVLLYGALPESMSIFGEHDSSRTRDYGILRVQPLYKRWNLT